MMTDVFKGVLMLKTLLVLACAGLLFPVWAQSQRHSVAKAQTPKSSAQTKARTDPGLTARLQARAIAEAAAQVAEFTKTSKPPNLLEHSPLKALPALTEAQPMSHSAPLAPGVASAVAQDQAASDPISQDLAIAQQIHQGLLPCEMGASVRVEAVADRPGYFNVQGKGFSYRMYPVRTSTGALRLEDKKAGAVWLQLANKSMLMDQNKGRRMADDCTHPEQVAYGQNTRNNPPPALFDTSGMGRAPD